jgi:hypothetical protein
LCECEAHIGPAFSWEKNIYTFIDEAVLKVTGEVAQNFDSVLFSSIF